MQSIPRSSCLHQDTEDRPLGFFNRISQTFMKCRCLGGTPESWRYPVQQMVLVFNGVGTNPQSLVRTSTKWPEKFWCWWRPHPWDMPRSCWIPSFWWKDGFDGIILALLKHIGRHPSTIKAFGIDKHAREDRCRPCIRPLMMNTVKETRQLKLIVHVASSMQEMGWARDPSISGWCGLYLCPSSTHKKNDARAGEKARETVVSHPYNINLFFLVGLVRKNPFSGI